MNRRNFLGILPFIPSSLAEERPLIKSIPLPQGWIGYCEVTGYCPCEICCYTSADGLTSLGIPPIEGNTVAADPTVFPYGTLLMIEGVGLRLVSDCGGAIKGRRLDVYFPSHSAAKKMGRSFRKVRELLPGEEPRWPRHTK